MVRLHLKVARQEPNASNLMPPKGIDEVGRFPMTGAQSLHVKAAMGCRTALPPHDRFVVVQ
jgi:hypothetical protein